MTHFNTNCIYCWHLLLNDFGPNICYIPGSKNKATNALNQLLYNDTVSQEQYELSTDDLSGPGFLLNYRLLEVKQSKDKALG